MAKTLDEMVAEAEADLIAEDEEVDEIMGGIIEVGFAAAAMFEASLGDEASASANVMTDAGMVRIRVSISEVD